MNNLTWYTWYSQAGYSDDNADDDVSDEKKTGIMAIMIRFVLIRIMKELEFYLTILCQITSNK